ncbi:hypothetical protein [Neolewinella agarilytica]|nr:hypothetical protein [Neolewinella agarilytica]
MGRIRFYSQVFVQRKAEYSLNTREGSLFCSFNILLAPAAAP